MCPVLSVLHAGARAVDHMVPDRLQGRLLGGGRCALLWSSLFADQRGACREDFLEKMISLEAEDVNWSFQWGNNSHIFDTSYISYLVLSILYVATHSILIIKPMKFLRETKPQRGEATHLGQKASMWQN